MNKNPEKTINGPVLLFGTVEYFVAVDKSRLENLNHYEVVRQDFPITFQMGLDLELFAKYRLFGCTDIRFVAFVAKGRTLIFTQ